MGYDCGVWIGKYVLCIFNFLFFWRVPVDPVEHACYERFIYSSGVLGTIVLGIGIWLAVDKASLIALLKMVENEHINQFTQPQVIEQLAYVLIAIGGVMFLMSFMGYCGAIRESKCLLTTILSDASKVGIELILSNFFTTHFVCLYNTLLCTEKYY
ncbi:hypothetical protein GQX74_004346 [Glossina fuscipes]|nr:hypothetical protein GQX74_004346 [Glossina fuscipes]